MTESPEAGTTQTQTGNGGTTGTSDPSSTQTQTSGSGSTTNSNTTTTSETDQSQGEGQSTEASEETATNAAKLLAADVARQQAQTNALATGIQQHLDESQEAQDNYDEVRNSVDDDALRFAYTTLLNPVGLGDQTRQVDTTGLGGFGASAGVVHAANVFGSQVQRAVAEMATQSEPAPVTVVGVQASNLADPESVERAKHGKKERKNKTSQ